MPLPQQSDVHLKHILEASSAVVRWGMSNEPTLIDPLETAALSDRKQQ